jgi:argininosuccinate lyase
VGKTWGGRFEQPTNPHVEAFTESISQDKRLYRYDIQVSQAHARVLAHVGLLTADEANQICAALDQICAQIKSGTFTFSPALEDIHTHIEHALIAELGDLGRKLHAGRSRNDQVATDMKLWMRDAAKTVDAALRQLQESLFGLAERERDVILPGYTHLRRAQPILAAHYALSLVEKFQRDRDRLEDTRMRLDILPLGSGALAGTSLPIDREFLAKELGFSDVTRNSLDTSSDRDFVLEYAFSLAVIAVHLSGWAEEWILWSGDEFNMLELPEEFCTGSSIMPQKKNPDVLELIRGRAGRAIADLNALLILQKGLPSAYNRDLQEDKAAIFQSHDTVLACLNIAAPLIAGAKFRRDAIAAKLETGFMDATTLMEFLVAQGMPMRSAHEAVGRLVRSGEERGCALTDLPSDVFEAIVPGYGHRVYELLGVPRALAAFRSFGSTAPAEVDRQLAYWRGRLGSN